ncbi:MAG: hypothetical protein ACHRXM_22660 [Isosphaerales bacterium]
MAQPDATGLDCPECGASNRPGATACFLCGHRLDTARPETRTGAPKSPASPTSPELVNPYAPPTTFVLPALPFRISSLMLVIAVIVVCLGVGPFGVAPALVYTCIVVAKSKARGRPMAVLEQLSTFLAALIGVVVIAVSAFIAFLVTCFPIGMAADASGTGLTIAFVIGGMAAGAAAFLTYLLLTRKRRREGIPGKP